MQLNRLLIATAALEASAGVALMSAPATTARLLLGAEIDAPGLVVARVAGAALFTTGILCWVVSRERSGLAARGLLSALLFYNVAVLVALAHANLAAIDEYRSVAGGEPARGAGSMVHRMSYIRPT